MPTRVGVESDWLDIQVGAFIACGLRAGDQLWCWGDNLGPAGGATLNPRQIAGAYTTLTVGQDTWCAIEAAGLVCQGRGADPTLQPLPADIVPVQISATHSTVCLIDDAKRLWCWGNNNANQIGTGDSLPLTPDMPHQITGEWQAVELGNTAACAIASDGRLSCWGQCGEGQLGRGGECGIPGVVGDRTFTSLSVGNGQTCAIDLDGDLFCMGTNEYGELGAKGGLPSYELLEVEHGEWTLVTAGTRQTCGLRADGEAWCWGDNQFGGLGDGGGGNELAPVAIDPGPFDKVFAGRANGCALREGTLWCWGANGFGQLGDGTTTERRRPVQIGTDRDWKTISITRTHACGIRDNGTLWCWGNNSQKQLGIGGNLDAHVPTQVGTSTGWSEIAVGMENACGILDGFVHCWGRMRTSMPELELDQPASSLTVYDYTFTVIDPAIGGTLAFGPFMAPTPEEVQAWSSIERGANHVCGLIGSELWCYGANLQGQLGRPADGNGNNPAEPLGGEWLTFSAGNRATCAITTDHELACWGQPDLNGLGKEEIAVDFPTPVGTALWNQISVGDYTSCGIQMDGSLHCWGFGVASGRGDAKGGHERPTRVSPP